MLISLGRRRSLGAVGVLLILATTEVCALSTDRALSQYTLTTWTQAEGLPQDTIRAITQTQDGYLWLGTNEGLVRFDGYDFLTYTKEDGDLPNNTVIALTVGHDGVLWIGTLAGLSRYAHGEFTNFTMKNGLPASPVNAIAEDSDGSLWIACGGHLTKFEHGEFKTLPKEALAPIQAVQVVYEDSRHQLWIGGSGGLLKRTNQGFSVVLGVDVLGNDFINAILSTSAGIWVAAGNRGIVLVSPSAGLKHFDTSAGLPNNLVRALWSDRSGNLWVGTNGGLSRLENGRFVSATASNGDKNSDWVWSLFEDREGDLWVGRNSSLNRLRDDPILVYGKAEGLPNDQPIVVHQDPHGKIWVGYRDGGLVNLRPGTPRVYTTIDGLPSNDIFAIRHSRNGDLLIATTRGLSRMHDGGFTNYTAPDPRPPSTVYDVLEDSRGHIWTAGVHGVHEWDGNHWQDAVSVQAATPTSYPVSLAEDRDGSIWSGTLGTVLWLVHDGKHPKATARIFATADQLGSGHVRSLYQDKEGTLWIGTFGGGLSALRNGKLQRWVKRDGLLSDNISHVEDDGNGNLWLSTTRGISKVSKQQLFDFNAGKLQSLTPRDFGIEDGLRSAQCAPGFPAGGGGTRTRDGHLWFPTGRGLAMIDPDSLEHKKEPAIPFARVVEVTVDGHSVELNRSAELKPGTGRIQIRYTGVNLSIPERVRYSTLLQGLDNDWVPAGRRRVVTYNPLPHGRYRFFARASLPEGLVSKSEFAFEVLPHYYETPWFFGLCIVSLLGTIYGIYLLRLRQINSRFGLILDERCRLSREIHDTLAQGFAGISSQLDAVAIEFDRNPNFARQTLELATKMARHGLTEARRSMMDLRMSELEQRDLPAAIEAVARRSVAGSPVKLSVDVSGVRSKIPEKLEQNLLRISQEAVANALKHAHARTIWVELVTEARSVCLRVRDDGNGFDSANAESVEGHFGIMGMQERAERLGGFFALESLPGAGTQVEVRVPFGRETIAYN